MKLDPPSIDSTPAPDTDSGCADLGSRSEATSLARAFDRALRDSARRDWLGDFSSGDAVPALTRAVRAFVAVGKGDGCPPERVLAAMKVATQNRFLVEMDDVRSERLGQLVMLEFLATYYQPPASTLPTPAAIE
jgi:hypothetical protein